MRSLVVVFIAAFFAKHFREVSRNSITTECADFQTVGEPVLKPISARASAGCGGETPSMNVMNLMVVALAGWINQQQEDVID